MSKSVMWSDDTIRAFLAKELPSAVALLKELVEQNSWSANPDGVNKVQSIMEREFQALNMRCHRSPVRERGDILTGTTELCEGRQDHLLLVGHADTVHPPTSPFLSFVDEGEQLRGPGVFDMKGGLVMGILALRALHEMKLLHSLPIRFVINSAEELGAPDAWEFMRRCGEGSRAILVLEFGRRGDAIITERNGLASFEVIVHGRESHVGNNYAQGASAIQQLARTILRLDSLTNLEQGIMCNVGTIRGGTSNGVVAGSASATFEVRAPSVDEFERIRGALTELLIPEIVGTTIEWQEKSFSPPLERVEGTLALFEEYHSFSARAGMECPLHPRVGGLSDANRLSVSKVPTLDGLGPFGGGEHTDQEFLYRSSLLPKTMNLILWLVAQTNKH